MEAELRPTVDYPEIPLLLECAGIAKPGRGHNKSEYLYILWQFRGDGWIELGRARSSTWDWAVDLAPLAWRAIEDQLDAPDLAAIGRRIHDYLESELERVEAGDRNRVAGLIHDEFAARLSERGWVGDSGAARL